MFRQNVSDDLITMSEYPTTILLAVPGKYLVHDLGGTSTISDHGPCAT